jgi:hypothetical protein
MGMALSVKEEWPKNKLKKEIEMSGDPWIHRSDRMRCNTCMWFVEKVSGDEGGQPAIGRCRRHAPTMSGYPVVFMGDWCGDHKLDENKA